MNSVSNGPVNGGPAPAGDPQPPIMADFETDNGTDASDVTTALREIKVHFDEADIEFFFTQFEMMMENAGVKSQWTKRCQLYRFLPPRIVNEMKDVLNKKKTDAGAATIYKTMKARLTQQFGPRPADRFYQAENLPRTGKPSQHAKALINILCPKHPEVDCCLEGTISGLWRKQLPEPVKFAVAGHELGGGKLEVTLQIADAAYDTWMASQSGQHGVAASALPQHRPAPAGHNDTLPAFQSQVPAQPVEAFRHRPRNPQPRGGDSSSGDHAIPARTSGHNFPRLTRNPHPIHNARRDAARPTETAHPRRHALPTGSTESRQTPAGHHSRALGAISWCLQPPGPDSETPRLTKTPSTLWQRW